MSLLFTGWGNSQAGEKPNNLLAPNLAVDVFALVYHAFLTLFQRGTTCWLTTQKILSQIK
jgi:hypothetical protein